MTGAQADTGAGPDTGEENMAQENPLISSEEDVPGINGISPLTGQYGTAQLQDPTLTNALRNVQVLEGVVLGDRTKRSRISVAVAQNVSRWRRSPHIEIHLSPYQLSYRVPEAHKGAIQEEVRKMLELGVIEEPQSAWASPIVLVPKPDGSIRFSNDIRKLNEVSEFDAYPMPRVDDLVDSLGYYRFVTTLDLTKGYWQVPLTPASKEKTAFATQEGLYQYTRLPFGLHGAQATFQRLMDRVLAPQKRYAAAYLDLLFKPL
ncbi:retrovirus-related Pol polyprotein from transposon 297 [Gasterosteus aculeatus]